MQKRKGQREKGSEKEQKKGRAEEGRTEGNREGRRQERGGGQTEQAGAAWASASRAPPRDLPLPHGALQERPPSSPPADGSLQQPRVHARTAGPAVSLEQSRQPAWHCGRGCISGGSLGKRPPVPTDPSTFPAEQDPNKFLGADSLANSSAPPISRQGGSAHGLHTEGMHCVGSGGPSMAEGLRPTWL